MVEVYVMRTNRKMHLVTQINKNVNNYPDVLFKCGRKSKSGSMVGGKGAVLEELLVTTEGKKCKECFPDI